MYLLTFPKNWAETFDINKDIDNTSYEEIDYFLEKQKEKADKEHSKREKEKKKKENDKKNHHKKTNWNGGKFKLDPNATYGPQARCTKCPDAKH